MYNICNKEIAIIKFIYMKRLFLFISFLFSFTILFSKQIDDHKILWDNIDSLDKIGLPKSALEIVNKIYIISKKENDTPEFLKALIHKLKYESQIGSDDNTYVTILNELNNECKKTTFPLNSILHSMIAEMYWKYYQSNRWQILNRKETYNFKQDDILTWSLKNIVNEVVKNYNLSLEKPDSLKKIKTNVYDKVIVKSDDSVRLRSTLFDFLANRAINFYINNEPELIKPEYKFEIDDARYFLLNEQFVNEKFSTKENLSMKFHAIELLQDLIKFHLNDKTSDDLIDVDLRRLEFVYKNSTVENKDSLYIKSLNLLLKQNSRSSESTNISYALANFYKSKGDLYSPLKSDEYKWMYAKSLDICDNTINKFPKSFGAQNCKSIKGAIMNKSLILNIEGAIVPDKPSLALITYKNISNLYFKVVKANPDEYINKSRVLSNSDLAKLYLIEKSIKEWNIILPNENDYQTHSVEVKIPELPIGFYVVLAATDQKFSLNENAVGFNYIWSTNISYINRNLNDSTYEFYVFDRDKGIPLKQVNAQLSYNSYDYNSRKYIKKLCKTYKSNDEGYFIVQADPVNANNSFNIEFQKEEDKFNSYSNFYLTNSKQQSQKQITTSFFLDREIYRPGQAIYFKGIVLETKDDKHSILPNYKTTVVLYDVNYQKVSELTFTTNEFGTFSGTFTAPNSVLNGQMLIANNNGGIYFSVEEYKRPKFEVAFEQIKGSYRLNETITVKGIAKAYAESNIDDAQVKYRVFRSTYYPYRWFWYDYFPSSNEVEITNGTIKTDANGEFIINFIAKPELNVNKKYYPQFNYTVFADVTDINGETHSTQTNISVSYKSLFANIEIPAMIDKINTKQEFKISTTNQSGQKEPAKGIITIYKLKEPDRIFRKRLWNRPDLFVMTKEEFYKTFPNDIYNNEENIVNWQKEKKIIEFEFNTEKDSLLKLNDINKYEFGQYLVELNTKDKYGEDVEFKAYFNVFSSTEKQMASNKIDWFSIIKNKGEPGEKASFFIGSKAKDVKVLFEIELKNKIIKKEWIDLNDEQKIVEVPIVEDCRGNFAIHLCFIKNNRYYIHTENIKVPYTNKELTFSYESFRNKLLPGQKEEWKLKIKSNTGEKIAAEMLASMYDASLDAFKPNNWNFNIYNLNFSSLSWNTRNSFFNRNFNISSDKWNIISDFHYRDYDYLNWFGLDVSSRVGYGVGSGKLSSLRSYSFSKMSMKSPAKQDDQSEEILESNSKEYVISDSTKENKKKTSVPSAKGSDLSIIPIRKNFNETAFFYPFLQTNENGDIIISFTAPESLTKWKFMGLAHTKDLKYGLTENTVVTQKDLMIIPNAPRFLREGDKISFTAKVSNITNADMSGAAQLLLFDALTMKPIDSLFRNNNKIKTFEAKKGQSAAISWDLSIPYEIQAVTYRVVATAGDFSDGEENVLPILTNRMLVTESMPLPIKGNQTKEFSFTNLLNSKSSSTLQNHKLTLEFTSNPAWYAIQSLPYLMEYPYECSEQLFSRFYANSIASYIANSNPKIKAVFDSWKNFTPDALLSNLQKNQELKQVILEETPWVLDAKDETKSKQNIALLFDLNKMADELGRAINKLQKSQCSNGGWPWFAGMPDDRYITQHIVTGIGHIDKLGVLNITNDKNIWEMTKKAIEYLDNRMREDYDWILKNNNKKEIEKNHIGSLEIQYLYTRSYFLGKVELSKKNKEAFNYFINQSKKYWLENNLYMQGMIAISLNRMGDKFFANDILKSLKEKAIHNDEMGMYWKDMNEGYYWYQAPIETQALMIEAFDEILNDTKTIDELKVWLLKHKQTHNWKTTKATVEASYALLLRGTNTLSDDNLVEITIGNTKIEPTKLNDFKIEAGTGYFKTSWYGSDVKPEMGKITVKKETSGDAWGALYWQYFEQLDKIKTHETPLKIEKKLFIERNTPTGPVIEPISESNKLKVGEKIIVHIELRVDRAMEYVHLKDMRASALEPINVLSQYKYQSGLGYYECTKDASTNFFFSFLPKGTFIFEYPLRVTQNGEFSNGITTIQCMYAPEFSSHSEGIRISVNSNK